VNQHILFSRDGNFTITLKQLASDVVLSPQDFDSWMEFQEFVFGDLLQITNPIFERNLVSPWLFVALRKTGTIFLVYRTTVFYDCIVAFE